MKKWVCQVCGYVFEGENPPEKCPQCGVPASKFTEDVYKRQELGLIGFVELDAVFIEQIDYFVVGLDLHSEKA